LVLNTNQSFTVTRRGEHLCLVNGPRYITNILNTDHTISVLCMDLGR